MADDTPEVGYTDTYLNHGLKQQLPTSGSSANPRTTRLRPSQPVNVSPAVAKSVGNWVTTSLMASRLSVQRPTIVRRPSVSDLPPRRILTPMQQPLPLPPRQDLPDLPLAPDLPPILERLEQPQHRHLHQRYHHHQLRDDLKQPIQQLPGLCSSKSTRCLSIVHLLMVLVVVSYYSARCSPGLSALQTRIRLSFESNRKLIADDGTLMFKPDNSNNVKSLKLQWSLYDFDKNSNAVRILTRGDYRISTKVCFKFNSNSEVKLEVRIGGEGWIRCHVSPMGTEARECCDLFSIRSMQCGETVSVFCASQSDGLTIDKDSSSFSLEKR